ncbi:MAG: acyl-CoA dehydrogenase [Alphaproteobacteria bacterium]|jgi:alkylation response protein AidB-like acyl-CoA dehydrogenase|nr:acyl-CoA dehydrogenase [Alphaproteobacteria bacterium]
MPDRTAATPIAYPETTAGANLFALDRDFQRWIATRAPMIRDDGLARLDDFGAWAGGPLDAQAAHTDRVAPPRLIAEDADGRLVHRLHLDPDYRACHAEAYRRGVIAAAYATDDHRPKTHLWSFVFGYLLGQADIAIHCPVTMTGAVAHVLDRVAPAAVRDAWLPGLIRTDGRALSGGTWATERHGGSDIGATTTVATPAGDGLVRLTGLKWFASNAGSDVALATARPPRAPKGAKGLGCYLVPARLPDGTANAYDIRRLKDKIGTRGLPTGEIALDGALAWEVAPPPDGAKAMMLALGYSRVHNAIAAAAIARRAFLEAACWASHRVTFGRPLVDRPMIRDQLIDLICLAEPALALAFEAASFVDTPFLIEDRTVAEDGPGEEALRRMLTALAKYDTAEAATLAARRAVELVGGNGYTEEWPTARLYRDSLVTAVWEGPATIQALEIVRLVTGPLPGGQVFLGRVDACLARIPEPLADLAPALGEARRQSAAALADLEARPADGERVGLRLMRRMADLLVCGLMVEQADRDLMRGDARKALVARRVIRQRLGLSLPLGEDDPALRSFDAVFTHAEIAP